MVTSCFSENGDLFLNKCLRLDDGSTIVVFAEFLQQWVNPRIVAMFVTFLVIVLPFFHFSSVSLHSRLSLLSTKRYITHLISLNEYQKMKLVNFLHRMCYSLVLDVAIYAIFRQHRPCTCTDIDIQMMEGGYVQVDPEYKYSHVGSIYGMPSGDAMAGALLGATIIDWSIDASLSGFASKKMVANGSRIVFGTALGIALSLLVAVERVVLGKHSVAQVTVGVMMGFLLHIYQTRFAPQFMIFVDSILQLVLGLIALNVDVALKYNLNDTNNLLSWFIWGLSFQLFVCLMTARHYFFKKERYMSLLKPWYFVERSLKQRTAITLETCMKGADDSIGTVSPEEYETLSEISAAEQKEERPNLTINSTADMAFLLTCFSLLLLVSLLSSIVSAYNWMGR
uniref:Phosphatidic acid phosphatase type 2/haloperoxidase domain-containing protein n=1 Tax=Percolomonas cosmopolitus TaxID=63605 RepID=A0A7S1PG15_9EUKA